MVQVTVRSTVNEQEVVATICEAIKFAANKSATLEDVRVVFENMRRKHPEHFDDFVDLFWSYVSAKGGVRWN